MSTHFDLDLALEETNLQQTNNDATWFLRRNLLNRQRLASANLRQALDAIHQASVELQQATDQTLEALFEVIGQAQDPQERKDLIAARRAISRGRAPKPTDITSVQVSAWEQAKANLETAQENLKQAYQAELHTERGRLAQMLQDPALALSLPLLTADVARQATRYAQAINGGEEIKGRLAKSERGLLQYATRAATRTSPLARLTSVGLTHAAPGAPAPRDVQVTDLGSTIALDRVMFDYVMAGALQQAGLQGEDPHLMVPPTGHSDGQRLFFLTPTEQGYARSAVALTGALKAAVERLTIGPVPRSTLVNEIATTDGHDTDDIQALLDKALALGMLTTTERTDASPAINLNDRGHAELDRHLHNIRTGMQKLANADAQDRAQAHTELENACAQLSHFAKRPARISINEDHVLDLSPIDPSAWGSARDDLGAAVDLLHVFDWLADVSISLEHAFTRLHGAGARVPLTQTASALVQAITEDALKMSQVYLNPNVDLDLLRADNGDDTLVQLYRARREIEAEVHRRMDQARDDNAAEVVLDPSTVRNWVSHVPQRLRDRALSYGVLVQQSGDRLVVNDGLPGHGMLYSRFLGTDMVRGRQATQRLARRVTKLLTQPGFRLLEDRGTQNLNVNVHPPVLPNQIEPQDWARLELVHDANTGTVRVEDPEGPVQVLPMGGGHPGLYPPALSVASGLTIAGRLYNGLADTYHHAHPSTDEQTISIPRVSVGDAIISRRRWYPGADFWQALAETDDTDRLMAIDRWRRTHDVPEEIFIKTPPIDEGPASVSAPQDQERRFRAKPQYVDLTSALSVRVLPRMMARKTDEAMPDSYIEEATPTITDGPHAQEWVVEADRPAGQGFQIGADHD